MLKLLAGAKMELTFWKQSIGKINGQPIWHSPSAVWIVYSDASNTGYGGYMVERFNSWYACPGSEAMDSFTTDEGGENNWWCPPPCLVARTIGHAEVCKAWGTLIVPAWQSAHYWPLLCPDGVSFSPFVVDMVSLPLYTEMVMIIFWILNMWVLI